MCIFHVCSECQSSNELKFSMKYGIDQCCSDGSNQAIHTEAEKRGNNSSNITNRTTKALGRAYIESQAHTRTHFSISCILIENGTCIKYQINLYEDFVVVVFAVPFYFTYLTHNHLLMLPSNSEWDSFRVVWEMVDALVVCPCVDSGCVCVCMCV